MGFCGTTMVPGLSYRLYLRPLGDNPPIHHRRLLNLLLKLVSRLCDDLTLLSLRLPSKSRNHQLPDTRLRKLSAVLL